MKQLRFYSSDCLIEKLLLIIFSLIAIGITEFNAEGKADRMNVLFIISDDLCNQSMLEATTPNLDRLRVV